MFQVLVSFIVFLTAVYSGSNELFYSIFKELNEKRQQTCPIVNVIVQA